MMDLRMFVYQPTPNVLRLKKKDKGTDYLLNWKSKRIYSFKLTPLYSTFLNRTNLSVYRTGIKFNNSVFIVEQNNYTSKHKQNCKCLHCL